MEAASARGYWARTKRAFRFDWLSPGARRILVAVVGSIVLLIGLAMTVLPGPAFIVIPLGLAILAKEFRWARQALVRVRQFFRRFRRQRGN